MQVGSESDRFRFESRKSSERKEGSERRCIMGEAMRIKKLELVGFKSFCDKTTILFNDDSSAQTTTMSVDGEMVQFEIPARGWATVIR